MLKSMWKALKVSFAPWTKAIIVVEYAGLRIAKVNSRHYETGEYLCDDFKTWGARNMAMLLPKNQTVKNTIQLLLGKRISIIGWVDCEMSLHASPSEYIKPLAELPLMQREMA